MSLKNKKEHPRCTKRKVCIGCGRRRSIQSFYYNLTIKRYSARCKLCCMALNKARTHRNRQQYFSYLKQQACIDCSIKDPIVLTHDHRNPKNKHNKVSAMIDSNSWTKIQEEIAKCDVVCANCHARRTAKMQGWYRNAR